MISAGDLVVVVFAVGVVLAFVAVARHFIHRAQATETAEDEPANEGRSS